MVETVVVTASAGTFPGLAEALRALPVLVEEHPLMNFAPPLIGPRWIRRSTVWTPTALWLSRLAGRPRQWWTEWSGDVRGGARMLRQRGPEAQRPEQHSVMCWGRFAHRVRLRPSGWVPPKRWRGRCSTRGWRGPCSFHVGTVGGMSCLSGFGATASQWMKSCATARCWPVNPRPMRLQPGAPYW